MWRDTKHCAFNTNYSQTLNVTVASSDILTPLIHVKKTTVQRISVLILVHLNSLRYEVDAHWFFVLKDKEEKTSDQTKMNEWVLIFGNFKSLCDSDGSFTCCNLNAITILLRFSLCTWTAILGAYLCQTLIKNVNSCDSTDVNQFKTSQTAGQ